MNIPETSAGAVRRGRLSPRRLVQLALPLLAALGISALYLVFRQQVQELALLGYGGLFAACLAANSTVLLPASSTLFTASASMALDPVLCCLIGAAGAAAGEQVSYCPCLIWWGWPAVRQRCRCTAISRPVLSGNC